MNEDVWNDLSEETQEQLQTILDGETNCYEFIPLCEHILRSFFIKLKKLHEKISHQE